jgi:hypothetical protein
MQPRNLRLALAPQPGLVRGPTVGLCTLCVVFLQEAREAQQ